MDHPLYLPQREDLLVQDLLRRFWIHPNPVLFQYHAWLLSRSTCKQQVFRQALRTECLASEGFHRMPVQCQVGRVLSVPSTESRSCLSRCALSGGALGTFVPENAPIGLRSCYRFRADGVWLPSSPNRVFWPKTRKPQDSTPWIVIPALGPSVGDHPDRKLCPVRVLKAYLERTKELEVRRGTTRLFLNPKKPESDISPAHISIWIKKLVQDANEHAAGGKCLVNCPRVVLVKTLLSKARGTRKAPTLMCGRWGLARVALALGEGPLYIAG